MSARDDNGRSTFVRDTWTIARRGVVHIRRQPEALSDATIQPIIFVLLFAYVFGGAINVSGGGYKEFLMGGVFAQTIIFGAFGVAIALSHDRNNGAIDRFHSMPISRATVLAGHAVASLARALIPIALMSLTGLVVGWRIRTGLLDAAAGFGLMVAFSFAMIWVGVLLASAVRTPEAVQGIAFTTLFPITFVASTFVPLRTMPDGLRTIAEWNPTSSLADALRQQFGNPGALASGAWPVEHPVAYTLLWTAAIVAFCAPFALRLYQRSIER